MCTGVTSPYPTVVTVWIAHHRPRPYVLYSCGSNRRIASALLTTTASVPATIALRALRTESGALATRITPRSIGRLGRATSRR